MPPRPSPQVRRNASSRPMPIGKPAARAVSKGMADANVRLQRAAAAKQEPQVAEVPEPTQAEPVVAAPTVPDLERPIVSRVRPLLQNNPAAPTVPLPLAHRVDEHNADIRRRLSVIESMQQRQWQALLELGHLLRQQLGVEVAEDESEEQLEAEAKFQAEMDAFSGSQGSEFGGVAAGDDVETASEDLGGEATSEDVA